MNPSFFTFCDLIETFIFISQFSMGACPQMKFELVVQRKEGHIFKELSKNRPLRPIPSSSRNVRLSIYMSPFFRPLICPQVKLSDPGLSLVNPPPSPPPAPLPPGFPGVFPGVSPGISRGFPGVFPGISRGFPGVFQGFSQGFPGVFLGFSRGFFGVFPGFSRDFPGILIFNFLILKKI